MFLCFKFGAAGAYNVKSACIAVFIDDLCRKFFVFVVNESAGAHEKSIEAALAVDAFDSVKQTRDHVVAAGSLSSR